MESVRYSDAWLLMTDSKICWWNDCILCREFFFLLVVEVYSTSSWGVIIVMKVYWLFDYLNIDYFTIIYYTILYYTILYQEYIYSSLLLCSFELPVPCAGWLLSFRIIVILFFFSLTHSVNSSSGISIRYYYSIPFVT